MHIARVSSVCQHFPFIQITRFVVTQTWYRKIKSPAFFKTFESISSSSILYCGMEQWFHRTNSNQSKECRINDCPLAQAVLTLLSRRVQEPSGSNDITFSLSKFIPLGWCGSLILSNIAFCFCLGKLVSLAWIGCRLWIWSVGGHICLQWWLRENQHLFFINIICAEAILDGIWKRTVTYWQLWMLIS